MSKWEESCEEMHDVVLFYPYQCFGSFITKEDKVFILLYWCGMSAADAYRFAYNKHNIKRASASTLGNLKKGEKWIERNLQNLVDVSRRHLKFKS